MFESASSAENTIEIIALEEDVPEVIQESFNALFYLGATINPKYRCAIAYQQEREQEGFDHWDYKYDIRVEWTPSGDDKIKLVVMIYERSHVNCDFDCQSRADQFASQCQVFAQRAAEARRDNKHATTFGSARWATASDLEQSGYLKPLDSVTDSGRLVCGILPEGEQIISVPEREAHEHALVCGPTGSGKSTGIFIPNIIRRTEVCALVTEVAAGRRKAEILYSRTAGWRAKNGHKILYFNPANLSSTRINPLDAIQSDDPELDDPEYALFYDSANYVASLLMNNTKELSPIEDKIWSQCEHHLITSLLLYVVGLRKNMHGQSKEGDGANLGTMRALLREGLPGIERALLKSKVGLASLEYSAFLKTSSPNFRLGVISGVMSRLNSWVNPKISTLTEVTDFNPDELKDGLFTFYFSTLITRPHYRAVAALALNYVIELLLEHQFKYPVTLLLDEFTNYGYIADIERKLQTIRNQEIGVVIGIQHTDQVRKLYKDDASAILGQPGTRIFFKPRDNASAKVICMQLGPSTIETRESNGRHTHSMERARPLLDESELMRLNRGETILFTGAPNPIRARAFPPDAHDRYLDLPVPELPKRSISQSMLNLCRRSQSKPSWERKAQGQINSFKKHISSKTSAKYQTRLSNRGTSRFS